MCLRAYSGKDILLSQIWLWVQERGKNIYIYNRPAGVIRLKNRFWVKAAGCTNWGKFEAAYVAVPFPPFNFRSGQDLIVRPAVIAVISVALQQTQPGGQWFAVSSNRAGPEINAHLPYTSWENRRFFSSLSPGYLLRWRRRRGERKRRHSCPVMFQVHRAPSVINRRRHKVKKKIMKASMQKQEKERGLESQGRSYLEIPP